jgi:prolyl-tRNA synthetase
MDAAGAEEFLLPSLHPAELWRASGRWEAIDETMFRLTDRRGSEYCLAMTHEELFTAIASADLHSYRQLPQRWYQIGPKFRDEPRPRGGLLRVREFLMKDAYSFDVDTAGLDRSFQAMRSAYERIYARCGVRALAAEADSGAMVRPAQPDEVFAVMGAHPGSLGAVRFTAAPVLVDASLVGRTELVTGANRDGFHLRGVAVDRDILAASCARPADLRTVRAGEACPACGEPLESFPALEVGHIFKLGTRYAAGCDGARCEWDHLARDAGALRRDGPAARRRA